MASRLLLVGVMAILGSTATRAQTHTLTVRLRNDAAVSAEILTDARNVVAGIYRQAKLELVWLDGGAAITIVLRPVRSPNTPHLAHDAMGYAPGGVERGRLAFVLIDRVTAVARGYVAPESIVLGGAIAHELGHLLISKEHCQAGVMKASFNQSDFRKLQDGTLLFSAEEAQAIRNAHVVRAGAPRTSATEAAPPLQIMAHVVADARVPAEVVQRAKPGAIRVYQQIGIDLIFVDESEGSDVTMRVVDRPIEEAGRSAMGVAPRGRGQTGRLLYAFYSRVEAYARQHDKPVSQVLGHVMAHELGHLLLPHGSHTRSGIMVAAWDRNQVEQIGRGWLSFSPEEAAQIRTRAKSLRPGPDCQH